MPENRCKFKIILLFLYVDTDVKYKRVDLCRKLKYYEGLFTTFTIEIPIICDISVKKNY